MASEGPVDFTSAENDGSNGGSSTGGWSTPGGALTAGGTTANLSMLSPASGAGHIETIKLVIGGDVVGDDFCTRQALNSTLTYYTFGGDGNTGGQSLTGAQLKAADTGLVIELSDGGDAITEYLKLLGPQFSGIPDEAEVTGLTIEIRARWVGFSTAHVVDHVRITSHYAEAAGGHPGSKRITNSTLLRM